MDLQNKKTFPIGCASSGLLIFGYLLAPKLNHFINSIGINIWIAAFATAIIITGIYRMGVSERNAAISSGQQKRDVMTENISKSPETFIFSLYLRSFRTSGRLDSPIKIKYGSTIFERLFLKQYSVELPNIEAILAYAMDGKATLTAIGNSPELGAGKVATSPSAWQDMFLQMAQYAKVIFIVPMVSPGTEWEILNLVRNSLLYKCIFIMPGKSSRMSVKDEWINAQLKYINMKISLPDYKDYLVLFSYNEDLKINWMIEVSKYATKKEFRKSIRRKTDKIESISGNYKSKSMVKYGEMADKKQFNFLSSLSAPARRALENCGIKTVAQLSKFTETDILKLHGVGPSSIPKLKKIMSDNGLSFATKMTKTKINNPKKQKRGKTKEYIKYHTDGSIWGKGQTLNGVSHGYFEWFRKGGKIMKSGHFDNGKQVGDWTIYDKNGKVYKVTKMKK